MLSSSSANAAVKRSSSLKRSPSVVEKTIKLASLPPDVIPLGRDCIAKLRKLDLYRVYRQIIRDNAGHYLLADNKKEATQLIANVLAARGVRFVVWDSDNVCWEDAPDSKIANKISAACREVKHSKGVSTKLPCKPVHGPTEICSPEPNSSPLVIPSAGENVALTTDTTNTTEFRPSRRPFRVAAMAATAAISQASKTKRSPRPEKTHTNSIAPNLSPKVPMDNIVTKIHSDEKGDLVAQLYTEGVERALRVVLAGADLQPKHPQATSGKRDLDKPASTRYPKRNRKGRNQDQQVTEEPESQTLASPSVVPAACLLIEEALSFTSLRSTQEILQEVPPTVSYDEIDKRTTGQAKQGDADVPAAFNIPDSHSSTPSDTSPASIKSLEPWWTGMEPDTSPFFVQNNSLFDRYPPGSFEKQSPLGLPAAIDLLSDFEDTVDDSTLTNLSPFSLPPCQFESLEEFESSTNSDAMELLLDPVTLLQEAADQEA